VNFLRGKGFVPLGRIFVPEEEKEMLKKAQIATHCNIKVGGTSLPLCRC
jgi:hypothetical protein